MKTIIKNKILNAKKIVALTGAGVSTASGIPDFRGNNGLYSKYPEDILSRQAFWGRTEEFYKAFQDKFSQIYEAKPNIAHEILAEWERKGKLIGIITQNVDGLHQRAGTKNVIEYHGTAWTFTRYDKQGNIDNSSVNFEDIVNNDGTINYYHNGQFHKPNIVLFEDNVLNHNEAANLIAEADLILILGTSFSVSPFNSLPDYNKNIIDVIAINESNIETYVENLIQINDDLFEILKEINNCFN